MTQTSSNIEEITREKKRRGKGGTRGKNIDDVRKDTKWLDGIILIMCVTHSGLFCAKRECLWCYMPLGLPLIWLAAVMPLFYWMIRSTDSLPYVNCTCCSRTNTAACIYISFAFARLKPTALKHFSSGHKIKHLPTINDMIFYNDGVYIQMEYIKTFKIQEFKISSVSQKSWSWILNLVSFSLKVWLQNTFTQVVWTIFDAFLSFVRLKQSPYIVTVWKKWHSRLHQKHTSSEFIICVCVLHGRKSVKMIAEF